MRTYCGRYLFVLCLCALLVAPMSAWGAMPVRQQATATSSTNGWWDSQWAYRVPLVVNANGYARNEKPVEIAINFTTLLNQLGQSGALDVKSLRLLEVDANGAFLAETAYQFDPDANFNQSTNAAGTLIFLLSGTTNANAARTYQLYFDLVGKGFAAPNFADRTQVTAVSDEGQASFRIQTDNATYYYQRDAGGFSSLVDVNGNDWLNYHAQPAASAGGSYRGVPNMVHPEGKLHPGASGHTTTQLASGPLKETFATYIDLVNDGHRWDVLWEFFPTYARMTVRDVEHSYWFLYEGTPGGSLELDRDFVMRSNGVQNLTSAAWTGDLAGEEWVYFGDPTLGRSLFLVHHEQDTVIDSYRPMSDSGGAMTVFGFGRDGAKKLLQQTPQHFTLGLVDQVAFTPTAETIRSAYRDLAITLGSVQQQSTANYQLVINTIGNGNVSLNPQQANYAPGTTVTLTATPANGYTFAGWSGDLSGNTNPATVTVNNNLNVTASFIPSGGETTITIVLDAVPDNKRNFTFKGGLGTFRLDDITPDDGDAYTNEQRFTVAAGAYAVTQAYTSGWSLVGLTCNPESNGQVTLATRKVKINVQSGQQVSCLFTVQKSSALRIVSYVDQAMDGSPTGDPASAGTLITLYDSQGVEVGAYTTNQYGKVSFTNLAPGEYTVCNGADMVLCHSLAIEAGKIATLKFGLAPLGVAAAAAADLEQEIGTVAVALEDAPTAWSEGQEESDLAQEDEFLNTPDSNAMIYLPLIAGGGQ